MNQEQDILLAHDHSKLNDILEQVFEALKEGDRRTTLLNLDYFWALLAVHIRAEHLHLFPILLQTATELHSVEAIGDILSKLPEIISCLRRDHDFFVKEIGKDVNRLRVDNTEDADTLDLGDVRKDLTVVAQRLTEHNEMEEKDIYPLAQALLTAEEIKELTVSIRSELANIPPRFAIRLQP